MPCLVYCIFADPASPPPETPPGVGAGQVEVIARDGLGAAVSLVPRREASPETANLLAYGKVVEAFHRQRTVIPLRYGCLCQDRTQAAQLLAAGRGQLEPLLAELEGCVEMGIRALLPPGVEGAGPGSAHRPKTVPRAVGGPVPARGCPGPGAAYLEDRLQHHRMLPEPDKAGRVLRERCRAALAGLFVKSLSEGPNPLSGQGDQACRLLSFYFLVPRAKLEAFGQAFAILHRQESARLLLSGPWPPYNFAAPAPGLGRC